MKSYSWVVAVVLILVVGVWVSLVIIAPSQNQPPVQAEKQVQAEEKQEPVWQLHVAGDSWGAWRFNARTGDAEFLHPGNKDFNKTPVVKFPAPK